MSGRRRGAVAALLRTVLRGLEAPYSLAVRWRNRRYDKGRAEIHRARAPVISVGNITLGGTGKTPTVEWLARYLRDQGLRVAIVSRGYGARDGRPNDEALELAQKLPDVPHVQDPDRVRGAERATGEFNAHLILLDDGFQHRRLARDFDLVLIDALEPYGFGHVFPRGTLREPLDGWRRADAFLLTRSEEIDESQRRAIRDRALSIAPQALWVESSYRPFALESPTGEQQPLESLAGVSVAAFCGIGNPESFRRALEACKFHIEDFREFADHFAYDDAAASELAKWVDALDVAAAICTHKDLVKIGERWSARTPVLALASRLQIIAGQQELERALAIVVASARRV